MGHILCNNEQTINEIFASEYKETRPTLVVRFIRNTGRNIRKNYFSSPFL